MREWLYFLNHLSCLFPATSNVYVSGKPKLFLVQACRGDNVVVAAGKASGRSDVTDECDAAVPIRLNMTVPVDADIVVFFASTPGSMSWVRERSGSWFIQRALDVFERHYDVMHVEDMMTLINFLVAEQRAKTKEMSAVQMPCKFSSLRMRFFL